MPGNIKLADAMRTLTVTIKDDGYELESTAGKAFYSAWGTRGKVEGIPEYFPISLSVKDESNPVPKAEQSKVQPGLDEQVSAQLTQISNADTSITSLASNADITRKTTSCIGALTSLPIVELTDAANDVLYALFFRGALASGDLPAKSGAAELRSLGFAETGHVATKYQGEDYFTWLTSAGQAFAIGHLVKTQFGKLNTSHTGSITWLPFSVPASAMSELQAGGAGTDKGSIGAAHICGNTIEQETLSGVLTNTLHHVNPKEAGDVAEQLAKAVKSAFYVLELDTSEAKERPDEFHEVISEIVYSAITKALKPGGQLREAINQKADVSGLQALSSHVSQVELALASHGSQITALQAKHASPR